MHPHMTGSRQPKLHYPACPPAHLPAQEIESLAPALAHRPGKPRLDGRDLLAQVVACAQGAPRNAM